MKRSRLSRGSNAGKKSRLSKESFSEFLSSLKAKYKQPESSATWLQNQYPALPSERLDKVNYLNYDNLQRVPDFKNEIPKIKRMLADHPEVPFVILAVLDSSGKYRRPLILAERDALYYPQYELFAGAYHLKGFVELFHNQKR